MRQNRICSHGPATGPIAHPAELLVRRSGIAGPHDASRDMSLSSDHLVNRASVRVSASVKSRVRPQAFPSCRVGTVFLGTRFHECMSPWDHAASVPKSLKPQPPADSRMRSLAKREEQLGVLLDSVSVREDGLAKLSHFFRGPIHRERQMASFKLSPFFGHVIIYWLDSSLGKEG